MTAIGVSDHALLRFLERGAALDVEALRLRLAESLERAHRAALSIGAGDYLIRSNGLLFVVREEVVTTVIQDREYASVGALRREHKRPA